MKDEEKNIGCRMANCGWQEKAFRMSDVGCRISELEKCRMLNLEWEKIAERGFRNSEGWNDER